MGVYSQDKEAIKIYQVIIPPTMLIRQVLPIFHSTLQPSDLCLLLTEILCQKKDDDFEVCYENGDLLREHSLLTVALRQTMLSLMLHH